ncbi:MAG: tRNA pseudouridine(38-40) synthase TruA [Anaerolineales bacterium]
MARYQVTLAYDGTHFSGFQRQANGRTVQAVVEHALSRIGWRGTSLLAAGRTDAGVHASGQVIAFDLTWKHGCETLQKALNANLPADVSALQVRLASPSFHPRYDALARTYHYRLLCLPARHPLLERYAWRVWPAPQDDLLAAATQTLRGEHDFTAFGRPPTSSGSTVRIIRHAEWRTAPPFLTLELTGNAFLYHMVRHIVALLVAIGQQVLPPQHILAHLSPPYPPVRGMAPPCGLTLAHVAYPDDPQSSNECNIPPDFGV